VVLKLSKRVPAAAAGTLFLLLCTRPSAADPPSLRLARDLFTDAQWAECRIEAARSLAEDPTSGEAVLLKAACERRLGSVPSLTAMKTAYDRSGETPLRAEIAIETARTLQEQGRIEEAADWFRKAFDAPGRRDLFLRAACSLWLLFREHPDAEDAHPGLRFQIRTCYSLFTPDLKRECAPPRKPGSWITRPPELAIRFYQRQIGPAIGERCSLHPSCSRYAVQALRRHGLLGLAMYADRGFREPSVVAARERVIRADGRRRVQDSLDEHDWWMRGRTR